MANKALRPDDRIGHYRVVRPLGAGGMGEVYLAHDETLERSVALKVLPAMHREDERVKRFVLEAKSASSLSHPHIITVYEIGAGTVRSGEVTGTETVHYIAMELVDGETLGDLIHGGHADVPALLRYLAQAADGLAKAHGSGIVHRDLKPGNIMVSKDGYAKVLDFGLAKLIESPATPDGATIQATTRQALTVEGMIVGTVGYMAPEQILGRPVDHRADIFSFGCILYEALTGARPFTADSQFEALQKIIGQDPPPIESLAANIPAGLRTLVAHCLAKMPDQRIASMKDVASELRRIGASYPWLSSGPGDATIYAAPIPAALQVPPGGSGATTQVLPQAPSTVVLAARKKPLALYAAIALVVLAAAGLVTWKFVLGRGGGLSEDALSKMKVSQILSSENLQQIAVSPEGKYAAYVTLDRTTKYELRVRQISTGSDVQIVAPQDSAILGLSFTPDGDNLWYVAQDPKNLHYGQLWQVPSLGQIPPKKAIYDVDTEVTFSPDGQRFAFMRGDPTHAQTTALVIHDNAAGADTVLATVKSQEDIAIDKPRWSPDGKRIAVIYPRGTPKIVVFDVQGGKQETIGTWGGPIIDSLAWMGNDGLVVAGIATPGPRQLWYLSYPGGQRRRLTNDTYEYQDVSASGDGKTIAARRTFRAVQVWQVGAAGKPDDMKPVSIGTSGPENISDITPADDGSLMFIAPKELLSTLWNATASGMRKAILDDQTSITSHIYLRGQNATAFTVIGPDLVGHVYRVNTDGTGRKQLTSGTGENLLVVSPDGKTILYNTIEKPRTLMAMPSSGGPARVIVSDFVPPVSIPTLVFSRDGSLISYERLQEVGDVVSTQRVAIPFAGGAPVGVLQVPPKATNYTFMPDGRAYSYIDQNRAIMSIPIAGGTPAKLVEMDESRIDVHRWIDAKTMILGVRSTTRATSNLWRWTLGTAKAQPLTNFPTGLLRQFVATPDGKTVYFTQGTLNRDLVMIRGLM